MNANSTYQKDVELTDVGTGGAAEHHEGYNKLRYTSKGEQYVELSPRDPHATTPEERRRLPILCPQEELDERFGPGTRLYFSYLKFNLCANVVLALTGIVSWAFYLSRTTDAFTFESFFVSYYDSPTDDASWFFAALSSVALWPLFALAYFLWEHCIYEPRHPRALTKAQDTRDDIVENIDMGAINTTGRRVCVFLLTGGVCVAGVAGIYGLLLVQNHLTASYADVEIPYASVGLLFSFAISLCGKPH